jgi:hypothetical protein
MGANVLYLKGGTRDHFMGFLAHAYPHMVERYERLYAGAYASPEYADTVRALVGMLQERHQVNRRTRKVTGPEPEEEEAPAEPDQKDFTW